MDMEVLKKKISTFRGDGEGMSQEQLKFKG